VSDFSEIDLLIVGAGPVGCTFSERAANLRGWNCLLIDKRSHIGGNCHDYHGDYGQLLHKYGPHYFRTNSQRVFSYLSKFTDWIKGDYTVKSYVNNTLFPFPINLDTLQMFFKKDLNEKQARQLLRQLAVRNEDPQNSEDFILSKLGKQLYESFYLGYTKKQWGLHPKCLSSSVCGRVPIRFNRDSSYVDAKYKLMPSEGFTRMFSRMTCNRKIRFLGNTDYFKLKKSIIPKIGTVFTGPIDSYFEYCFGKLPWRSLEFEWKTFNKEFVQPCVQINYPNDFAYTRSVEIKHVTKQKTSNSTISYEYPRSIGDPYYPIPSLANSTLYQRYKQLSQNEKKVFFVGRLAEYTYINTDQAVLKGLDTFEQISELYE
jgi:UDP-galactopyranose mutase